LAQPGSSVYGVSRTAGQSTFDIIATDGQRVMLSALAEPITGPALAIDVNDNVGWVSEESRVLKIDLSTGAVLDTYKMPSGGSLRHVGWDYDGHLFGIWQSQDNAVSTVEIPLDHSDIKILFTLNVTGPVRHCYYGVTEHHYLVVQHIQDKPDNMYFISTVSNSVYKSGVVDAALDLQSVAIDYIHNNVYFVSFNHTSSMFDFGIVHMTGALQQVLTSTNAFVRAGGAAVVDADTAIYYTSLYSGSAAYYVGFHLHTATYVSYVAPYDLQSLGWSTNQSDYMVRD